MYVLPYTSIVYPCASFIISLYTSCPWAPNPTYLTMSSWRSLTPTASRIPILLILEDAVRIMVKSGQSKVDDDMLNTVLGRTLYIQPSQAHSSIRSVQFES